VPFAFPTAAIHPPAKPQFSAKEPVQGVHFGFFICMNVFGEFPDLPKMTEVMLHYCVTAVMLNHSITLFFIGTTFNESQPNKY